MNKINLSPDAATGAASEVDPMSQAAGPIKSDFPLLPERRTRMIIRSPEVAVSTTGNDMFVFKLETTEEFTAVEGEKLHKGFRFTKRIMLTPPKDKTMEDVAIQLRELLQAVNGPKNTIAPSALRANPSLVADKPVDGKIVIRAAKGEFGASNDFRFEIPKA